MNGAGVLVTRPAAQAENLCRLLEEIGAKPLRFPTLRIQPLTDLTEFRQATTALADYHWAIFVSQNAVEFALRVLALPVGLKIAAIGKTSALALQKRGYQVDLSPQRRFDSIGLLEEPQMQQVAGQHILIFRGRGGKETLATVLRERGAKVTYAESYQRTKADSSPERLDSWLRQGQIQAISLTSQACLQYLLELASNADQEKLRSLPLAVISEELANAALRAGFYGAIRCADEASDRGLLEAIIALVSTKS